ncbi:Omp28-related outer membrane protein [Olleya sp. YS]|uniref:Omp28-related outer membrane protein n=1 Tax=Olleya sp. YS TaxID=3028318 RepID=UPI00243429C5|nr:Omp28-related outer membrane protein [Olleya sp. YS]WGD35372.1 Omp28-related outer membrane protein [Olleya sp. YS]
MKIKNILKELVLVTFVVFAFSCSKSEDEPSGGGPIDPGGVETAITIENVGSKVFSNSNVAIWVINNNGVDVTADATIYVNDTAIASNLYTFTSTGSYSIRAVKGTLESPTVTVEAILPTHTTKIMIEDYTGGWCGYCPRLATALENAVNQDPNVIPVAIHNGDEMTFTYDAQLRSTFGINGWPSGKVNRTITWNESYNELNSELSARQKMGLAINSSLSGNTITAEVKVHYDIDENNSQRLVVYLLENGLVYPQTNYYNGDPSSPWFQQGNPIQNFVHDHTARAVFTDVMGNVIPSDQTKSDNTYTANLTMDLPSNVQNTDNLELVAFVVGSNNQVQNAQKANLGENKDFD